MYLLTVVGPLFSLILVSLTFSLLKKKYFFIFIFSGLIFSLIICSLMVYEVVYLNSFCLIELNTWFKLGVLNIKWSFFFDKLSTFMLFLIILISLLVHFFALDYLTEDPHLSRFLILLTFFTIFMEILVTSGNLLQFFFGWEGVGLMSYLLINFWFTRFAATNSGLMAIIYNRIGDTGLLLGISLICFILETTDFLNLFILTQFACGIQIKFFNSYFFFLDILTILLFLGVIGKSAQIFLESWLASAMEGPTPVSSLLHASTMIVSGVFLLQRFQPYILCSTSGMVFITFTGALTAFFAGTIGLVTMDLKRIIAYSTCSQMGYLVFCVGIGNTNVSFFHLFNHAFFKCLLFIAAGTLIHALKNEQDIRKMGGLFKLFPFTFILILFASFSLMGIPFLSGYYSKEKILEYSFYIYNNSNLFSFWLGSFSAFLTSVYSMRFIFISFLYLPNNFKKNYSEIHTNLKSYLNIVLFILGLGSIFSGFVFEDLIIGPGNDWLIFTSTKFKIYNIDLHIGEHYLNFLTFYYTLISVILIFSIFFETKFFKFLFIYLYKLKLFNNKKNHFFKMIYNFLAKRWYLNLFYNRYLASLSFFLGYNNTFILLDKGFFEGPSLLIIRYISDISKVLILNFYRHFYFGELLLYMFLIYFFYLSIFILDLSFIFFKDSVVFLNLLFFFLAVPKKKITKKKKKTKKNIYEQGIEKKCSLTIFKCLIKNRFTLNYSLKESTNNETIL